MACSSSSLSLEALATTTTINESYSSDDAQPSLSPCRNGNDNGSSTNIRKRRHQSQSESCITNSTHGSKRKPSKQNKSSAPPSASQNPLLLLICAAGICTCYLYYGIIQEKLFSKKSGHGAGAGAGAGAGGAGDDIKNCGNTTTFMLVLPSTTNVIVSKIWISVENYYFNKKDKTKQNDHHNAHKDKYVQKSELLGLNHKLFFACAFCFFAAMTASNESLTQVSYPTAVLAKSSKLIPTMMVGFFIERKTFLVKEWISAALITMGIIIFNFSRMNHNSGSNGTGVDKTEDSIYGLFLLGFSLAMDGLLAACQNKLKGQGDDANDSNSNNNINSTSNENKTKKYRTPKALETMLWTNAYALLFLLPLSIWSGQFANGIKLMNLSQPTSAASSSSSSSTPYSSSLSIRQTIIILNLTAATGQIFIFFTIHFFSSIMCTTITTTRKFLTILLSVWKFGHQFTYVQWAAIFMVFGGLYLGIVSKFIGGGRGGGEVITSKLSKKDIIRKIEKVE